MAWIDSILKWIGILAVVYLTRNIILYIFKKLGVDVTMTWRNLFNRMK